MIEKRFKIIGDNNLEFVMQDKIELPIYDYNNEKQRLSLKDTLYLLNILNDENEQLKSTIKEVTELLSDEVDLFSEKATEHDIIAYVELKELDNKDAYYMATATKKAIQLLKEVEMNDL